MLTRESMKLSYLKMSPYAALCLLHKQKPIQFVPLGMPALIRS